MPPKTGRMVSVGSVREKFDGSISPIWMVSMRAWKNRPLMIQRNFFFRTYNLCELVRHLCNFGDVGSNSIGHRATKPAARSLLHRRNHCPTLMCQRQGRSVIEPRPRVQFPALLLILRAALVSLNDE